MRWFLSYNSADEAWARRLEAALRRKEPRIDVFFAPKTLRAGGLWLPTLAREIDQAAVFVLLIGESGVGSWQVLEYCAALERWTKDRGFPLIPLIIGQTKAPGLPFLRLLHCITADAPDNDEMLALLLSAAEGTGEKMAQMWRFTVPYRGLEAMSEADSEFFFGRLDETVHALRVLLDAGDRLPILIGNSGVGKSSLAQAGVIAALKRQAWPVEAGLREWPPGFGSSRSWCFLSIRPGQLPLRELAKAFVRLWFTDRTDPIWDERTDDWAQRLLGGGSLKGLLDATEERLRELGRSVPPATLIYIDQAEELYTRADDEQRHRFSEILAQGLEDSRLRAFMSLRADFYGALQSDAPVYALREPVDVPPLPEGRLCEVIERPAQLLDAVFEPSDLPTKIAARTAEESVEDAGALTTLAYLLDDMWQQMLRRDDGVLRLPARSIEVGAVLARRAEQFLSEHAGAREKLRQIFTLKLATVREDGSAARRRAERREFSDEEWRLVSELADYPWRLVVTARPEGGEAYAEVAHEALFRRWATLRRWVEDARDFLAWKAGFERLRRAWEVASEAEKEDALLMGRALAEARIWLLDHEHRLEAQEITFVKCSIARQERERRMRDRQRAIITWGSLAATFILTLLGILFYVQRNEAIENADAALAASRNADAARNEAFSRQLAANAVGLLTRDLPLSLLLSIEATQVSDTPEARNALLTSLLFSAPSDSFLHYEGSGRIMGVNFSARGHPLALIGRALERTDESISHIQLWDLQTNQPHGEPFAATGLVAFSPDGRFVASAHCKSVSIGTPDSYMGQIGVCTSETSVWEITSADVIKQHEFVSGRFVRALAFSPDNELLMTEECSELNTDYSRRRNPIEPQWHEYDCRWTHSANIWNLGESKRDPPSDELDKMTQSAGLFALGPDNRIAAGRKAITIWDFGTGKKLRTLKAVHKGNVTSIAFSLNGQLLATGDEYGTIVVWELDHFEPMGQPRTGHPTAISSLAFRSDGEKLISGSADGTIVLWHVSDESWLSDSLHGHAGWLTSIEFHPDGQLLLSGSWDGTVKIWNIESGEIVGEIDEDIPGRVTRVFHGPGGDTIGAEHYFVNSERPGSLQLWDAQTLKKIREYTQEGHFVVAPKAATVARMDRGTITLMDWKAFLDWDPGNPIGRKLAGREFSHNLSFTEDGTKLATVESGRTITVWDIATARPLYDPIESAISLSGVAFGRNGQVLAAPGTDESGSYIFLWDALSGKLFDKLPSHGSATLLAFDPRDQILATATSQDKGIALWDVRYGRMLGRLYRSHRGDVLTIAFSPDGSLLAVGYRDGAIHLWDLTVEGWITRACHIANRSMTSTERRRYLGTRNYSRSCQDSEALMREKIEAHN
jgi:WD40 repeat protein